MFKKINLMFLILCTNLVMAEELTQNQKEIIQQKALEEFAQIIFTNAMEAKRAFQQAQTREALIENFATTAPRSEFIINADISNELAEGVISASLYVSTDGQTTWQSANANLLGTPGYENTWEGNINTSDGNTAYSYLSGVVESSVLGEELDYGTIIVSGSPHNMNANFPPASNLYATLVTDESGDTSANQDILAVRGSYQGEEMEDADGNTYTDVNRLYVSLDLNGNCCEEEAGFLFGPWFLYGVGLVNPEATSDVAYAIGYGNGGFGELTPGVLKVSGDLTSGEVSGFEYLSTNIAYSTAGNSMQANALMSILTNDSDWGTWPNSYNGLIALGVTVEAGLNGLDVDATVKDQTDPGLFICTTSYQDGNIPLVLSAPNFDENTNTLSIDYSDADGNLPWFKSAQICYPNGGNCFFSTDMIPDAHTYEDGVTFSVSLNDSDIAPGDYDAKFWFADADIDEYPSAQVTIPVTLGGGGCALLGDTNGDSTLNVLDVVLLVNIILDANASGDECSDVNGDGAFNVLDVVLLVNLILNP